MKPLGIKHSKMIGSISRTGTMHRQNMQQMENVLDSGLSRPSWRLRVRLSQSLWEKTLAQGASVNNMTFYRVSHGWCLLFTMSQEVT